jgi:hypothetical protein
MQSEGGFGLNLKTKMTGTSLTKICLVMRRVGYQRSSKPPVNIISAIVNEI